MFPAGALRDQARDVTRISAAEEGVQRLLWSQPHQKHMVGQQPQLSEATGCQGAPGASSRSTCGPLRTVEGGIQAPTR